MMTPPRGNLPYLKKSASPGSLMLAPERRMLPPRLGGTHKSYSRISMLDTKRNVAQVNYNTSGPRPEESSSASASHHRRHASSANATTSMNSLTIGMPVTRDLQKLNDISSPPLATVAMAVPFRTNENNSNNHVEVLLVTTTRNAKWTFPKGSVRSPSPTTTLTPFEMRRLESSASVAECLEESGALGVTWHPHDDTGNGNENYQSLARYTQQTKKKKKKALKDEERDVVVVHGVRIGQTFEPDDPRWPVDAEGSRGARMRAWIPLNLAIQQVFASLSARDAQIVAANFPEAPEVVAAINSLHPEPRVGMPLARASRQPGVYAALLQLRHHFMPAASDQHANAWLKK